MNKLNFAAIPLRGGFLSFYRMVHYWGRTSSGTISSSWHGVDALTLKRTRRATAKKLLRKARP
ncbi:hypothetical protein [Rhizobium sp. LC145]|jgi:hypothetical protein|uniref:hypothetical protein n=1 Tax=Rhizobium sp. LC145 TaxID=1120688 RepID=UPI00062A0C4B|nr:hypothetical protein [Rhizobium sp. LC145]KKX26176.1 hypothetical protein YH62_24080 [Rhizobium sp. LC145]TKT67113.1 hypothetical protein FDR95_03535 [Rhizobiaceae bacterium LC148]